MQKVNHGFSLLLALLVSSVLLAQPATEVLNYDILLWGDTIGQMETSCTKTSTETRFKVTSDVLFKLMIKRNMQYFFDTRFRNGKLYYATTKNIVNEDVRSWSRVDQKESGFEFRDEDGTELLKIPPITFSILSLYYQEPLAVKKVFSERYGEYCSIEKDGDHTYKIKLPNGRHSIYSYKNGRCSQVKVDHPLATFYFVLHEK